MKETIFFELNKSNLRYSKLDFGSTKTTLYEEKRFYK